MTVRQVRFTKRQNSEESDLQSNTSDENYQGDAIVKRVNKYDSTEFDHF
jgi:hypothetical protein